MILQRISLLSQSYVVCLGDDMVSTLTLGLVDETMAALSTDSNSG